jgi:hypothetical protein
MLNNDDSIDSINIFDIEGLLQQVLGYVGPGHWLFIAEVSKLWQRIYRKVASARFPAFPMNIIDCSSRFLRCRPQMTLGSALFALQSTLRWAHAAVSGLSLKLVSMRYIAGVFTDQSTLALVFELAATRGLQHSSLLLYGVAASGCTSKMKWFCTQRSRPLPREAMWHAASSGSIDMLELLNQLAEPERIVKGENRNVLRVAAYRGHLHIIKYLHLLLEDGYAWSAVACFNAVSGRHLDILRWLHENGCAWDFRSLCECAARQGSIDIMMYLQQQSDGVQWNTDLLRDMLSCAGRWDKLAAAKWLRQQGAEWPARVRTGRRKWNGDVLQWARAEGCTTLM